MLPRLVFFNVILMLTEEPESEPPPPALNPPFLSGIPPRPSALSEPTRHFPERFGSLRMRSLSALLRSDGWGPPFPRRFFPNPFGTFR